MNELHRQCPGIKQATEPTIEIIDTAIGEVATRVQIIETLEIGGDNKLVMLKPDGINQAVAFPLTVRDETKQRLLEVTGLLELGSTNADLNSTVSEILGGVLLSGPCGTCPLFGTVCKPTTYTLDTSYVVLNSLDSRVPQYYADEESENVDTNLVVAVIPTPNRS